jgi:hypothetical protein
MKKLLFLITSILSLACHAQDDKNILLPQNQKQSNFFDNFTIGGNIGASFGNNLWGVSLAPRIGYKVTEDFEVAFSVNYYYQKSPNVQYNSLSLGPSLNYYIARNFYVKASYQHYFIDQKTRGISEHYKREESALYLGAGYMQYLGGRSYLRLGFSYNVLYDKDKSIFSSGLSPEVGIVIGL